MFTKYFVQHVDALVTMSQTDIHDRQKVVKNKPSQCIPHFFFQAEDGIRDYKVTGLQTCALPIYHRQALAMMDHPNIAKVIDAGATETGRLYFVMELVRGVRITDYCDQSQASTQERLDLFIKVCQAIQHAHQKGNIHRDIKPSNILVTLHDGVPVPKVIDFGIAKATGQRLTDKTLFTAFQQFIGTPAYMSPEQAEMSGLDVDTRSDIYSLRVLLYEMLTGSTPFDTKELTQSGLDEMRKIIREREPLRPSTRVRRSEE